MRSTTILAGYFMTHYFIKDGEEESGPYTVKQLKSKCLQEETLIWHAGLKEWTYASETFGLKELFQKKLSLPLFAKNKLKKIFANKKIGTHAINRRKYS